MAREVYCGALDTEVESHHQAAHPFRKVEVWMQDFRDISGRREHIASSASDGAYRAGSAIERSSKSGQRPLDILHRAAGDIEQASHGFLRPERPMVRFRDITLKISEEHARNPLTTQFLHPRLRLFLCALFIDWKQHLIEFNGGLHGGDQHRIGNIV
jgi:hypothetical protein